MQPLSPFIWAQFPLFRRCVPLGLMGSWTLASSQPAALPLCAPSIKLRVGFHAASQFCKSLLAQGTPDKPQS